MTDSSLSLLFNYKLFNIIHNEAHEGKAPKLILQQLSDFTTP